MLARTGAYNNPDYLLQKVTRATRGDEIIMHFEGQPISSQESVAGVASELPLDLAPVSLVVAPHLERIYAEMGRRCIGREGDPHRWVNPEFHGKRFGEASLPFEQSLTVIEHREKPRTSSARMDSEGRESAPGPASIVAQYTA